MSEYVYKMQECGDCKHCNDIAEGQDNTLLLAIKCPKQGNLVFNRYTHFTIACPDFEKFDFDIGKYDIKNLQLRNNENKLVALYPSGKDYLVIFLNEAGDHQSIFCKTNGSANSKYVLSSYDVILKPTPKKKIYISYSKKPYKNGSHHCSMGVISRELLPKESENMGIIETEIEVNDE